MKAIEASDPYEKRLKPIQQDVNIKMGPNRAQSPWVVRLEGDPTEYANESGALVCHGVVVIRARQARANGAHPPGGRVSGSGAQRQAHVNIESSNKQQQLCSKST